MILKLKVYIGYKQIKRNITKFIEIHEDLVDYESGLTTNWKNIRTENRFWQQMWVDKVVIMI